MNLLTRLLSLLRRECKASRLCDLDRPTLAELFRDGRMLAAECGNCGSRSREWPYGVPCCASCGVKLG